MARELSRWGVGPRILTGAIVYGLFGGIVTYFWPEQCLMEPIRYSLVLSLGLVLLAIGVPMLVVAGRAAMLAYNSDQLGDHRHLRPCTAPNLLRLDRVPHPWIGAPVLVLADPVDTCCCLCLLQAVHPERGPVPGKALRTGVS